MRKQFRYLLILGLIAYAMPGLAHAEDAPNTKAEDRSNAKAIDIQAKESQAGKAFQKANDDPRAAIAKETEAAAQKAAPAEKGKNPLPIKKPAGKPTEKPAQKATEEQIKKWQKAPNTMGAVKADDNKDINDKKKAAVDQKAAPSKLKKVVDQADGASQQTQQEGKEKASNIPLPAATQAQKKQNAALTQQAVPAKKADAKTQEPAEAKKLQPQAQNQKAEPKPGAARLNQIKNPETANPLSKAKSPLDEQPPAKQTPVDLPKLAVDPIIKADEETFFSKIKKLVVREPDPVPVPVPAPIAAPAPAKVQVVEPDETPVEKPIQLASKGAIAVTVPDKLPAVAVKSEVVKMDEVKVETEEPVVQASKIEVVVEKIKDAVEVVVEKVKALFVEEEVVVAPAEPIQLALTSDLLPLPTSEKDNIQFPQKWVLPIGALEVRVRLDIVEISAKDADNVLGKIDTFQKINLPGITARASHEFVSNLKVGGAPETSPITIQSLEGIGVPKNLLLSKEGNILAYRYSIEIPIAADLELLDSRLGSEGAGRNPLAQDNIELHSLAADESFPVTRYQFVTPYIKYDPKAELRENRVSATGTLVNDTLQFEKLPFSPTGKFESGVRPAIPIKKPGVIRSVVDGAVGVVARIVEIFKPAPPVLPEIELNLGNRLPPLALAGGSDFTNFPMEWVMPLNGSRFVVRLEIVEYEKVNADSVLFKTFPMDANNRPYKIISTRAIGSHFRDVAPNPDRPEFEIQTLGDYQIQEINLKADGNSSFAYRYVLDLSETTMPIDERLVGKGPRDVEAAISYNFDKYIKDQRMGVTFHTLVTPFFPIKEIGFPQTDKRTKGSIVSDPSGLRIENFSFKKVYERHVGPKADGAGLTDQLRQEASAIAQRLMGMIQGNSGGSAPKISEVILGKQLLPLPDSNGGMVLFPIDWDVPIEAGPLKIRIDVVEFDPEKRNGVVGRNFPDDLPASADAYRVLGTYKLVTHFGGLRRFDGGKLRPADSREMFEIQTLAGLNPENKGFKVSDPKNFIAYRYCVEVPMVSNLSPTVFPDPGRDPIRTEEVISTDLDKLVATKALSVRSNKFQTPFFELKPFQGELGRVKGSVAPRPNGLVIENLPFKANEELVPLVIAEKPGLIQRAVDVVQGVLGVGNDNPATNAVQKLEFNGVLPPIQNGERPLAFPTEWKEPLPAGTIKIQLQVVELPNTPVARGEVFGKVHPSYPKETPPYTVKETYTIYTRQSEVNFKDKIEHQTLAGVPLPKISVAPSSPDKILAYRYIVAINWFGVNENWAASVGNPGVLEAEISAYPKALLEASKIGGEQHLFRTAFNTVPASNLVGEGVQEGVGITRDPEHVGVSRLTGILHFDGPLRNLTPKDFPAATQSTEPVNVTKPGVLSKLVEAVKEVAGVVGKTEPVKVPESVQALEYVGILPPFQAGGNLIAVPLKWENPMPAGPIRLQLQVVEFYKIDEIKIMNHLFSAESPQTMPVKILAQYSMYTQFNSLGDSKETQVLPISEIPTISVKASSPDMKLAYRYVVSVSWFGINGNTWPESRSNPEAREREISDHPAALLNANKISGDLHVFRTVLFPVPSTAAAGAGNDQALVITQDPGHVGVGRLPVTFEAIRKVNPTDFRK